jgi:TPR repeat protein
MIGRRASVLSTLVLALGAFTALDGCGAGGVGAAVRPKEATAAEGLGEGPCREAENSGEPLVVDWKPEQRGDLELMMKENVAIVSYSCKGFKLLKDCKVDGNYGFLGMSRKEQVVKLNNADEVKANLPLGGIGIAGNISAEMARGSTLDVAMIMVGKVKTTWAKVQADELKGECDGATHFVKGAMVGAFVMQTGTKGQVKSAAQMFGASASGASTSEKNVQNKDGDIADCAKATPDDKKAPSQCQAFIRLELKGIIPKAAPAAGATAAAPPPAEKPSGNDVAVAEATCPKGLVMSEGKCTEAKSAAAYLCNPKDANDCVAQCGKGNVQSCGAAGSLYVNGGGGASRDEKKARELLAKGCDGSDTKSCTNLGVLMLQGRGGAKDSATAAKNFEKGCGDADALACNMLGMQYKNGDGVTKDDTKAVSLLQKGCEGGNDAACATYGKMLLDGTGTAKDPVKAKNFLRRACDGNQPQACIDVGNIYEQSRDVIGAKIMYQRGCWRGNMQACFDNGRMELGFGGQKDAAKRAFEMGCMRNDKMSCAAMKVLFGGTQPVFPGPETMEASRRCDMGGSPRDCGVAGLVNLATGNPMGQSQIERACMQQDGLACAVKNAKK